MGTFVKGDIVIIPFPFSDLTGTKKRPALVVSTLKGDDLILCQITTRNFQDIYALEITDTDFINGNLSRESNIRPNRLFTADTNLVLYRIGTLSNKKMTEVINAIIDILNH